MFNRGTRDPSRYDQVFLASVRCTLNLCVGLESLLSILGTTLRASLVVSIRFTRPRLIKSPVNDSFTRARQILHATKAIFVRPSNTRIPSVRNVFISNTNLFSIPVKKRDSPPPCVEKPSITHKKIVLSRIAIQ